VAAPAPATTLPREFYARPTLHVARDLIGKVLVHDTPDGSASGIIVEAEAYIGEQDPACHAAPGPTPRNAPLYGPPGRAYVYLNYGMHYLVNAVTQAEGDPAAVLLRALAPLDGLDLMRERRAALRRAPAPSLADDGLCRGPGNLTCALGITLGENRLDLCASRLRIEDRGIAAGDVAWSPRIGISVGTEQWWRAFVRGHPCVSGGRAMNGAGLAEPRTQAWPHRGPASGRATRRGPRAR
jgi:DNA-3-methyladenine glycosylase